MKVDQKNFLQLTLVLEVDHLLDGVSRRNGGRVWKELLDLGVEFVLFVRVVGDVV